MLTKRSFISSPSHAPLNLSKRASSLRASLGQGAPSQHSFSRPLSSPVILVTPHAPHPFPNLKVFFRFLSSIPFHPSVTSVTRHLKLTSTMFLSFLSLKIYAFLQLLSSKVFRLALSFLCSYFNLYVRLFSLGYFLISFF